MNDDENNYNDSDEEISDKHSQLLKSIGKLDKGQRIKKPERSEPTLKVSEFHLVNSGITDNDAICVDELVGTLGGRTHYKDITKKFNKTKKLGPVLSKPLEKPDADKLKRAVGFENTTKELEKWNAIITRNRFAPKQKFPLQSPAIRTKPMDELTKRFRIQSTLENELNALEPKEANKNDEKTNEFSLTLAEIMQQRLEAAKFRAQQSYKQAKAHRQKKIKSKKFHRIERNAKIKEQIKEFDKLQQINPESALEKLEQLSRARAEERMSLKHKNTSQWAKNKHIRAKYDKESRQALAQQLSISRELMQKVKEYDNSDDETIKNDTETVESFKSNIDNPWVKMDKSPSEVDEFVSDYRKYLEKVNKDDNTNNIRKAVNNDDDEKISSNNQIEILTKDKKINQQHVNIDKKSLDCVADGADNRNIKDKIISCDNEGVNSKKITSNSALKNGNVTKKVGTSEWAVEIIDNPGQSINSGINNSLAIDDMFDAIDNSISQKLKKKLKRIKRKLREIPTDKSERINDSSNNNVTDLSFKKTKLRPELDEALNESTEQNEQQQHTVGQLIDKFSTNNSQLNPKFTTPNKPMIEINPSEFIHIKSSKSIKNNIINNNSNTHQDDIFNNSDEDNIDQENIISEAFADDNVEEEFKEEKINEIKKSESACIDMRLPGWGSWGGHNIKQSLKKKRRFILKFPQNTPRNDENKGNVILFEDNSVIKKHQVNDLPYPFNSVQDFETSIRAPIGRNFIPENAHKRLIEPAVRTKIGHVIDPMDEDVLIKKKITLR